MTTPQRPIGSGFGHSSTADDVLDGIDLTGTVALVTGGYSGLGLATTRALTKAGAQVVVGARRPVEARAALDDVPGPEVEELDLGDQASVADFADRYLATGRPINLLIGNAGVMACPETRVGPGWERQFATNHLGHYALANRLWPAIADGQGRVVAVSSGGHRRSGIRWDDIQFEQGYDKWQAYGQAKTANALFALQLNQLAADSGVEAFSIHPGKILTPLQRHMAREEMMAVGWVDADGDLIDPTFKTPEQGAATQVWAATSPQLKGLGGVYCEDCDIAEPTDQGTTATSGVARHATDPEQAARLWELSATLTGVDAFSA